MDAEQLRVYFPYQRVAGRHVRHLPADLRPEVRARRAALQVDRRPAALCRLRRARPASRWGCSTSTCSRARANTITSPSSAIIPGKLLADGKYQRPTVALICNFPPPDQRQALAALAQRRGNAIPRVRPRHALDHDARQVRPFLRHQRPARFCRGPLADAGELGLGQEGAGQLRRRLPRSVEEDPRRILAKLKEAQLATEGTLLSPANLVRPDGHGAAHADPRRATPPRPCRCPTRSSARCFCPSRPTRPSWPISAT